MAPSVTQKAAEFEELHRSGCFVMANAWDAGSARLLENEGFPALGTTSAGLAWMSGHKDGATSRDAVLANARAIAEAVSIPVSGDLLNGFGASPETVAETIRLAGEAGLAGGSIEDTTGDAAQPLFEPTLAKERIIAAVEAARGLRRPFVLCARADGLFAGASQLDDLLARLTLYQEAGADVLYAPMLRTLADFRAVVDAVDKPVNVLAGIGNEGDVAELAALGVRRISVGSLLYGAVAASLKSAARELQDSGSFGWSKTVIPYRSLNGLMR
ncbi:MAG: isocitrate lyase/phosphoenolpyruvate mutase family protein [Acidobacteriota bacterium]